MFFRMFFLCFFLLTFSVEAKKKKSKREKETECASQRHKNKNKEILASKIVKNQFYDNRRFNSGWFIGIGSSLLNVSSETGRREEKGLLFADSKIGSVITFGYIGNIRITPFFSFRLLPQLLFSSRALEYVIDPLNKDTQKEARELGLSITNPTVRSSSVFIDIPFHIKSTAMRINDHRLFFVGGVKYSRDLASLSSAVDSPLEYNKNNFFLEIGSGGDFYFDLYRFGLQITYSHGILTFSKRMIPSEPMLLQKL